MKTKMFKFYSAAAVLALSFFLFVSFKQGNSGNKHATMTMSQVIG